MKPKILLVDVCLRFAFREANQLFPVTRYICEEEYLEWRDGFIDSLTNGRREDVHLVSFDLSRN